MEYVSLFYNWKEINFPPKQQISFFVPYNTEKIRLACKSKYNFTRENQVIFLMITDDKKWHYLAVKSLSVLPRGITSNHNGDFYCLITRIVQKINLENTKKWCNDHDCCYVEMPNEDNKISKYNHGGK